MKKAFTIMELLVVISVLSILVAVVIPRFKGIQDNAKAAKARSELQNIQAAIESYKMYDSSRSFPTTTSIVASTYLANAVPRIISDPILYDPFVSTSNTEYNYQLSSNGKYYVIWSVGYDGISQTTGVSTTGQVTTGGDDICVTNGNGCTPGVSMSNACNSSQTLCSGSCYDLQIDTSNCGSCGTVCGQNQVCTAGSCVNNCTSSCAGKNCGDDGCGGSCGACAGGKTCQAGVCTCSSGQADCGGGTCQDVSGDLNNCGSCGNVCVNNCQGDGCPSDLACCSGTCTFLDTDYHNCGACGNDCGNGSTCSGVCSYPFGHACNSNSDCQSYACNNNACGCSNNNDCNLQGGYCSSHNRSCTDGSIGQDCSDGSNCQSGYCNTHATICSDGTIGSGCGNNAGCQSNYCDTWTGYYVCSTGAAGQHCRNGTQCQSASCVGHICQ